MDTNCLDQLWTHSPDHSLQLSNRLFLIAEFCTKGEVPFDCETIRGQLEVYSLVYSLGYTELHTRPSGPDWHARGGGRPSDHYKYTPCNIPQYSYPAAAREGGSAPGIPAQQH